MPTLVEKKSGELSTELRQKTLEAAKRHKASWVELGQHLQVVYKDKYYKEWGFLSFEAYCVKELGVKQPVASKLIKSYQFVEKEEPALTEAVRSDEPEPRNLPSFESVNLLRLAKENPKLTAKDYAGLRESVMEEGREPKEVRAQVKKLLSEREEEEDPKEVRRTRRNTMIRRLVSMIQSARREFESGKLLPGSILQELNKIAGQLEGQIE